jgi:hypothetical protein
MEGKDLLLEEKGIIKTKMHSTAQDLEDERRPCLRRLDARPDRL